MSLLFVLIFGCTQSAPETVDEYCNGVLVVRWNSEIRDHQFQREDDLASHLQEVDSYSEDSHDFDGQVDYIFKSYFSAEGNITSAEFGITEEEIVSREVYTHDQDGNLILWEQDAYGAGEAGDLADGIPERQIIYTYFRGRLILEESDYEGSGGVDDIMDGVPDTRTTYEYDGAGNLVEQIDYDENDRVESRVSYEYDENNNLVYEVDYDGTDDGTDFDWSRTYQYDENNNLVYEEYDTNDTNLRRQEFFEYDENNNLILWETDYERAVGDGVDGSLDLREAYEYDENNNLVVRKQDGRGDDTLNGVWDDENQYTYDGDENLLSIEMRTASGEVYSREFFEYDENGNLYNTWRDVTGAVVNEDAIYNTNHILTCH